MGTSVFCVTKDIVILLVILKTFLKHQDNQPDGQHGIHAGEVRQQLRGSCGRKNQNAHRRKEKDRHAPLADASSVCMMLA